MLHIYRSYIIDKHTMNRVSSVVALIAICKGWNQGSYDDFVSILLL